MSQTERVQPLADREEGATSGPVGYWIHAAPRVRFNHALEYAIHLARTRRKKLFCFFVVDPEYPGATERHLRFLAEGLRDCLGSLSGRGISCAIYRGKPDEIAVDLSRHFSVLVTDRGYSRTHEQWYASLRERAVCPVYRVESNVVVPVETTSTKEEYSAATIRRKIASQRDRFLVPIVSTDYNGGVETPPTGTHIPIVSNRKDPMDRETFLSRLGLPAAPESEFVGGESVARHRLTEFIHERIQRYETLRNVPDLDWGSHLSPYLHFGQISPVEIGLAAIDHAAAEGGAETEHGTEAFLEELIVRRELAVNFVRYNEDYDSYNSLTRWARDTLAIHREDARSYTYTFNQLQNAETHDPYWNACQREMIERGVMHGYMRMYWGKKILEWTADPEEAYARAVALNDTWELDGRDPNGWAGVAWCFGKHDRPWAERPVFGTVRYMNDAGLRRKFKSIDLYVARWTG